MPVAPCFTSAPWISSMLRLAGTMVVQFFIAISLKFYFVSFTLLPACERRLSQAASQKPRSNMGDRGFTNFLSYQLPRRCRYLHSYRSPQVQTIIMQIDVLAISRVILNHHIFPVPE